MNKKGMTLVEVIISVGLISVVMLFLFNLLLDMQYENSHASYLKENQVNRATIIKTVEEDLMNNTLNNVRIERNASNSIIRFDFTTFVTELTVMKDRISYEGETWLLETNGNADAYYDFENVKVNPERDIESCSYNLNVDSDGDGVCNYNCDTNNNGILDESERSTVNETFKSCSSFKYYKVIVPAITGTEDNIIDDLEFFYIGRTS